MGLLGDIGSIGGSVLGTAASIWENSQNRKFQENMSNTAMQRRVADLRAAGLNPIIAATSGTLAGASQPSGGVPDTSGIAQAGQTFASNRQASTARQVADQQQQQINSNIQLQAAQAQQANASSAVQVQQIDNQKAQANLTNEQALTEAYRRANFAANTGLSSAQQVRTNLQAVEDRVRAEYLQTPYGRESTHDAIDNKAGNFFGPVNILNRTFSGAAREVKELANPSSAKGIKDSYKPNQRDIDTIRAYSKQGLK